MGTEAKTKALVLHEMPIGDYDKRLILLTKDFGKVTAFAKGARRASSPLLAASQTFAYGDFVLYKGRQSYGVNQVQLLTTFHGLRADIEQLSLGLYVLEMADFISVEGESDPNVMQLILKSLQLLERSRIPRELVVAIFEMRMMVLNGYRPCTHACIACGAVEALTAFSATMGGCLCPDCGHRDPNRQMIDETMRYTVEYICSQPLSMLFQFELDAVVMEPLKILTRRYVDVNLNKQFKALEFLKIQLF